MSLSSSPVSNWYDINQAYLMRSVDRVRVAIERYLEQIGVRESSKPIKDWEGDDVLYPQGILPALEQLGKTFKLSAFEQGIILLCVGVELDASFASLCAVAQSNLQHSSPTFRLALSALATPSWNALSPDSPLRYWRLIDIGPGQSLTLSPLRIDEWVLHFLLGIPHLDQRLRSAIHPLKANRSSALPPSHRSLVEKLAKTWSRAAQASIQLPVVQLCGDESGNKRSIAIAACEELGLNLHLMPAKTIPTNPADLSDIIRLWEREAAINASALILDCDRADGNDAAREAAIDQVIEEIRSPLIVTNLDRRRSSQRTLLTFEVRQPTTQEQETLWHSALGTIATSHLDQDLEQHIRAVTSQFNLSANAIRAACADALGSNRDVGEALWDSCRVQSRLRLDDLIQRLDLSATWDDLVLPDAQRQVLQDVVTHVQQRFTVYENWGFASKGGRGLGISALFAGASGTGKTMAAEVVAGQLRLDLYRVDLSAVVSKYIGETEKNLRRIFDAAEAGGAVLLFDEADALFGKRSEVKDSHDRHANIEVSYLLQRMEAYQGLAILTTNLKDSIDQAFLRRIRFAIRFPFPDVAQRKEIWRRVFPKETPTQDIDVSKLARLGVAGGNIRNIALNAAFFAADAGEPVGMRHLLQAARSEYVKMERSLTEAEVKDWV